MLTVQDQFVRPGDDQHPATPHGRIGVLLVNLGTPDSTSYGDMRRYLSEFLSDRRMIEIPQILWQPLLQTIILTFRPSKSGAAYKKIWMEETDESPLRYYTRSQAEKLAARLNSDRVEIDWAMRYGQPSLASKIDGLREKGCERIVICPLYPQYAAATTATVNDKVFDHLKTLRWQPAVRTLPPFYDHPAYIEALAGSIAAQRDALDFDPDVILMSYHGIPESYFRKGDPYFCHCAKTTRLVREHLGLDAHQMRMTFQSRFGPQEWLQPYTDDTLEALPGEGIKSVMIAAPAFISDCVETLEELAIEGREIFLEAGGEHFAMVPCLNDSTPSIDMLEALVRQELSGWV